MKANGTQLHHEDCVASYKDVIGHVNVLIIQLEHLVANMQALIPKQKGNSDTPEINSNGKPQTESQELISTKPNHGSSPEDFKNVLTHQLGLDEGNEGHHHMVNINPEYILLKVLRWMTII